ncbi:hypothetical protein CF328_g9034 [Tilletia controversa]|nr:hypothetical protein CF328_g9034 [Tilletia controversa]KAE8183359.1 hypothetical protein CF335_g8344 [Tilletia laevis]
MHNIELGLIKRLFHRTLIDGASVSKPQLQVIQTALASASVPPSEQAPDRRLGDPGGGSATAAHWSTLGRRMLVLLLYVAWRRELDEDRTIVFVPTKRKKSPKTSNSRTTTSRHADSRPDARSNSVTDAPHQPQPSGSRLRNESESARSQQQQQQRNVLNEDEVAAEEDDELSADPNVTAVGEPKSLSARAVMRNVAQLAAVATLTAKRTILPSEIQALEHLVLEYGRRHAELFGEKWIVYNHHIATHIPQFIRRFGPPFHFSAYHFERMNGQLGNIANNGHRNGEVEATYTSAFTSNARFGLLVAAEKGELNSAVQARAPPISRAPTTRLSPASVLGDVGSPLTLSDDLPNLLHPTSPSKEGLRVVPQMQAHATMRLAHISLSGTSSRANANKTRTFAVVDGRQERLDLFKITAVLSHTIHLSSSPRHVTVFLLGSRAAHYKISAFEDILNEAQVSELVRLFWVEKETWGPLELLPAHKINSDAVLIEAGDLLGVSAGEDQRRVI